MKKHYYIVILLLSIVTNSYAQEIDNVTGYKSIIGKGYVKVGGDDDCMNGTDDQYTEGLNVEISTPGMKHFFLTGLLINPHYAVTSYGIGLEQAGYTPENLREESYNENDRPFAGVLLLKTFLLANDPVRKQSFDATLYTGVIGAAALGGELQDFAHQVLGDVQPPGWKNQIKNDVAVNYQVNYAKNIFAEENIVAIDATIMGRIGTLSDRITPGLNVMFGNTGSNPKPGNCKQAHLFVYDAPQMSVVGFEATLEGGMFDKSSSYVLLPADISRFTFLNRTGAVLSYGRCMAEIYHCYLTSQFTGDATHSWDGVQLTMLLKK